MRRFLGILFLILSFILLCGCSSESDAVSSTSDGEATSKELTMDDLLPPAEDPSAGGDEKDQEDSGPRVATAEDVAEKYKDLPVKKFVQQFPNKKPYQVFTAKILPNKSIIFHGPFAEFYQNGQQQKSASYNYGRKNGEWTFYGKDGVVRKKGSYDDDKQIGEWRKFRADGTLKWVERYDNGQASGAWESFSDDGKTVIQRLHYLAGEYHGAVEDFFPDGKKKMLKLYESGKLHGMSKQWYDNGQLAAEVNYVRGVRNGEAKAYTRKGNISNQVTWKDGKRLSGS